MLFEGLQKAYQELADLKKGDSDSENDDSEIEEKDDGLASDEDEIDEATLEYLEHLNKGERDSGNECSEDIEESDDEDFVEETDLEAYETPIDGENAEIDEFMFFRESLLHLQNNEPGWYYMLMEQLSEQQQKSLLKVMQMAEQRKQLADSKQIDRDGGYQFDIAQPVPTNFNFGGQNL